VSDPITLARLREELWRAVADGDEYTALALVQDATARHVDGEVLLLDVIARVQERVGTEWAAGRLSVAQEHAATAINERVVAALGHHTLMATRPDTVRGRVTVACVDGEWHAFPARLVAEVLRLRGWHVDYLGAQTPTPHLVAHLHHTNTDAVLLSGSIPTHLPAAHAAITACQSVGVPVLAGGRAFGIDGRHARALGVDGWAPDARGAAAALEKGLSRPAPHGHRQAVDDLPHLADQEYTLIVRSRARLVRQTMADLEDAFPAARDYSDAQRERTAEDLAHILDFLATALYMDDGALFTDFLTWTAGILEARGVPARSLTAGLDLLAERLRDFPRTRCLIGEGTTALHGRPAADAHA
jgi:methanogenic corrinoid protein MtbC1